MKPERGWKYACFRGSRIDKGKIGVRKKYQGKTWRKLWAEFPILREPLGCSTKFPSQAVRQGEENFDMKTYNQVLCTNTTKTARQK